MVASRVALTSVPLPAVAWAVIDLPLLAVPCLTVALPSLTVIGLSAGALQLPSAPLVSSTVFVTVSLSG